MPLSCLPPPAEGGALLVCELEREQVGRVLYAAILVATSLPERDESNGLSINAAPANCQYQEEELGNTARLSAG